ncbi:YvrJ family protein [Aerococcaceae bacterium zg-ZJ1578]|nr:YvrJ family protein [Aerococcaceae bacterium zg-1578]
MEDIITIIGNFGFPIALVFYFLFRFEQKIDQLSKTIEALSNQMNYR